jgi:hypothetical protein
MSRNWVAVASAEHVRLGRSKGFMQVCHGKAAPLKRIQPGDGVVYYSPTNVFRGNDRLQSFTAIGVVRDGAPYHASIEGFSPFRRDVDWRTAAEVPIKPLLGRLQFIAAKRNWGFQLRFGLFEISAADIAMIAEAMGAVLSPGESFNDNVERGFRPLDDEQQSREQQHGEDGAPKYGIVDPAEHHDPERRAGHQRRQVEGQADQGIARNRVP